jgi:hypothetical protein
MIVRRVGKRFSVIVAPPGSAVDARSRTLLGGAIRGLIGLVGVIFRSGRRGWRVAVTPCDFHGLATGAVHRERVADQESATARSQAIVAAIRGGHWPGSYG